MRIAFVHKKYIDYRLPLFEWISKVFDTTFFFEYEWKKIKTAVRSSFSLSVYPPRRPRYCFSPALPLKLLLGDFDIYLAGDIGLPNTYLTGWIAKLKRKPFVVWSEEWHPDWYLRRRQFPWKRKVVAAADACIASGTKSKDFYQFLGVEEKKIFIAPNASIPPQVKNDQFNLRSMGINIPDEKLIILFLGRLLKGKGIDFLINTFRRIEMELDNVVLIIAGEGPLLKILQKKIYQLKNVILTGKKADNNAKRILYSRCDIFIVPSVFDLNVEPWGLVLNEAMYFGKPVITTNMVGGAFDLVNDGVNGYIIPERNISALFKVLYKLITNTELRKSMGSESKKIIKSGFELQHMVKGFVEAIYFAYENNKFKEKR